ncbi:ABC transporter substrate-binding protein [Rhizobium sp. Leaf384]|uniref:ABC transporter substrate-binding protein n=1 Tax=unclassified Rhizobium TaxID=2613769 RepID=UPI000715BF6D|nr:MULTISPECIES: ABC transporter substrate-binding protein [unclassified Rhizobium]KQR73009.1 ABC transporter substrate-binding protein [Rhizobium sp. Leaf341]KQS75635.1 ABC transporter substrate-binding protein [Rhizobium sp. Leaf384]KQS75884.1 ABC transporter substrate-binding protein [Rhizobium sp. Leaf383]
MKKLLASSCLMMGMGFGMASASAADCGSITIASMNWQSAEVISNLDKLILNEGYGCQAEITVGDTVPTITSMAEKGQPDIAPEAWIDLLPDVVAKGTQEGRIVKVGSPLPDGGNQGWWIPKYLADKHPDIKTIPDLLKHPELFPSEEDASKGAILNGPQGWGGTVVTTQLFKAFEGEKANFTLVDTGSAAGLDGAIAKAYEREKGFAAYYWAPTALLGKYPMVKLEAGVNADAAEWKRCNTVADCPDPKPNAWPVDTIVTLVAKPFSEKAGPEVMSYLEKRSWSNDTIGKLMAWMTDNQASGEDGAKHFLKENKDIWTKWVSADAAAKIEAAL